MLAEMPASTLARITGARKGAIIDGFHDDETSDRLLSSIANAREIATRRGSLRGAPAAGSGASGGGELGRGELGRSDRRWSRAAGDQSNSVAFVNDRFVLKLFRRIEPTINPEYEIGRFLTERGFTRTPALAGALEYMRPGLEPGTLAVVQTAVKHQGSGWELAIGELRRYYERVAARGARVEGRDVPAAPSAPTPFFTALSQYAVQAAETLGRRTSEMHATLAQGTSAAFVPEALDRPSLRRLADGMIAHADASIELLKRRQDGLNETSREHAAAVVSAASTLRSRFDDLPSVVDGGYRIRVHGDYHLGQVLRAEEDFVILDFEGEPDRSIAERREKQSPVKDVAGMIRSFSYAAYAALFAFTVHAPDDYATLAPWADAWQRAVTEAFVDGYRAGTAADPRLGEFVPAARSWTDMLRAFALDKALYELGYELNHRPDWVRIPLIGIRKLME
jgi:maltose alpha-D-glucosyltransferase/alpha-amylase